MANEVHSPHTIKTDMGKLVINSEANTDGTSTKNKSTFRNSHAHWNVIKSRDPYRGERQTITIRRVRTHVNMLTNTDSNSHRATR